MLDRHAPWWPTTVPTSMCKYSLDHLQINAPAPWTDASTSSGRLFLPKHMSAYDLFLYFFEAYIYFLENLVSSLKFLCNVKWVSWVFLSFGWLFTYDTVILMFILPTPRSKCSLITVVRETFEAIVMNQGTFMKKTTGNKPWHTGSQREILICLHVNICLAVWSAGGASPSTLLQSHFRTVRLSLLVSLLKQKDQKRLHWWTAESLKMSMG